MRVAARPVSASSCVALTFPRAYRSNRPTAIGHAVGVDLEGVRRLRQAPEAEPGMPTGIMFLVELGGVALGDPL